MANTTLKVTGLKTYYRTRLKENVYAVDGVDLELQEGRVLGIAGESGCGKSTLSTSIMGFYFPPLHFGSGSIEIGGTDIMTLEYEELRTKFRQPVAGRHKMIVVAAGSGFCNLRKWRVE